MRNSPKAYLRPAQNGGACKKGDPYDAAVRVVSQWGFELKFRAGKIGDEGVDVTLGVGKPDGANLSYRLRAGNPDNTIEPR